MDLITVCNMKGMTHSDKRERFITQLCSSAQLNEAF